MDKELISDKHIPAHELHPNSSSQERCLTP